MARKEYEYEVVWVGQPNNPRNNTWKGKQELIDLGLQKMVGAGVGVCNEGGGMGLCGCMGGGLMDGVLQNMVGAGWVLGGCWVGAGWVGCVGWALVGAGSCAGRRVGAAQGCLGRR